MKTYLILLVSMALLFSLGCSKKIVVVKASPPDQGQSQTNGWVEKRRKRR